MAPEVGLVTCGDLSTFTACGGLLGLSVASLRLAPEVGFEPTTNRLTADRSTTELLRIWPRKTSNQTSGGSLCQGCGAIRGVFSVLRVIFSKMWLPPSPSFFSLAVL
jgi:hypothetical protein